MRFSRLLFVFVVICAFSGCYQDKDTPENLKRETYYNAKIKPAEAETITCDDDSYVLPRSDGTETLGLYILKIHAANRQGPLAKMEIEDMQKLYRSCLRPAILNRVQPLL